jgi:hypothetical protein
MTQLLSKVPKALRSSMDVHNHYCSTTNEGTHVPQFDLIRLS